MWKDPPPSSKKPLLLEGPKEIKEPESDESHSVDDVCAQVVFDTLLMWTDPPTTRLQIEGPKRERDEIEDTRSLASGISQRSVLSKRDGDISVKGPSKAACRSALEQLEQKRRLIKHPSFRTKPVDPSTSTSASVIISTPSITTHPPKQEVIPTADDVEEKQELDNSFTSEVPAEQAANTDNIDPPMTVLPLPSAEMSQGRPPTSVKMSKSRAKTMHALDMPLPAKIPLALAGITMDRDKPSKDLTSSTPMSTAPSLNKCGQTVYNLYMTQITDPRLVKVSEELSHIRSLLAQSATAPVSQSDPISSPDTNKKETPVVSTLQTTDTLEAANSLRPDPSGEMYSEDSLPIKRTTPESSVSSVPNQTKAEGNELESPETVSTPVTGNKRNGAANLSKEEKDARKLACFSNGSKPTAAIPLKSIDTEARSVSDPEKKIHGASSIETKIDPNKAESVYDLVMKLRITQASSARDKAMALATEEAIQELSQDVEACFDDEIQAKGCTIGDALSKSTTAETFVHSAVRAKHKHKSQSNEVSNDPTGNEKQKGSSSRKKTSSYSRKKTSSSSGKTVSVSRSHKASDKRKNASINKDMLKKNSSNSTRTERPSPTEINYPASAALIRSPSSTADAKYAELEDIQGRIAAAVEAQRESADEKRRKLQEAMAKTSEAAAAIRSSLEERRCKREGKKESKTIPVQVSQGTGTLLKSHSKGNEPDVDAASAQVIEQSERGEPVRDAMLESTQGRLEIQAGRLIQPQSRTQTKCSDTELGTVSSSKTKTASATVPTSKDSSVHAGAAGQQNITQFSTLSTEKTVSAGTSKDMPSKNVANEKEIINSILGAEDTTATKPMSSRNRLLALLEDIESQIDAETARASSARCTDRRAGGSNASQSAKFLSPVTKRERKAAKLSTRTIYTEKELRPCSVPHESLSLNLNHHQPRFNSFSTNTSNPVVVTALPNASRAREIEGLGSFPVRQAETGGTVTTISPETPYKRKARRKPTLKPCPERYLSK